MARLRHPRTGVVVLTDDDTASRLRWPSAGPSAGSTAGYDDMTVEDLKNEIRARNEDRDEDDRLTLTGSKSDLIASLEADDQ